MNQDKKQEIFTQIDEKALFERVSSIIETRKYRIQSQANQESVLMF